jgi:RNA polymerase sigma factor (sigma-70 family)
MIDALKQWDRIKEPYPWCRQVSLRKWMQRAAKNRNEVPTEDVGGEGSSLVSQGYETELVETQLEMARLQRQLPLRQRQVMALTYDGATPSEIAEDLGIPAVTVRSHLRIARIKLQQLLRKSSEAFPDIVRIVAPTHYWERPDAPFGVTDQDYHARKLLPHAVVVADDDPAVSDPWLSEIAPSLLTICNWWQWTRFGEGPEGRNP